MADARAWLERLAGNRWIVAAALALIALGIYLPGIGVGDFVGDDEALDAGVVWEMRHSGDWLFAEFNGEYLPPKPPLFYWAAATASVLHGRVDEWSLRIPSAVAAAAMVGVAVAATAPAIGLGPAALGGGMLATLPIVFREARSGRCDMLLTLIVTGCLLLAALSPPGAMSRRARWSFWSLLGLAALTKGGAGVGLVAVVMVAAAAVERDRRILTRLLDVSIAAFFVVGGAWYVVATEHWGRRFVDEQIIGENLHHLFGGSGISDKGSGTTPLTEHLFYYVIHLFPQTAPWGLAVPFALRALRRADPPRAPTLRFFAVWLVAGLAFFTMVSRKSPYYLLPLAPPVALLAGAWAFERATGRAAIERVRFGPSARRLVALAAAATVVWLAARLSHAKSCESFAVAQAFAGRPLATILCGTLLGAGVLGAVAALRRRSPDEGIAAVAAAMVGVLTLSAGVTDRLDNCASLRPFAAEVRTNTSPDDRVRFLDSPLPAVVLYSERRIPTLASSQEPPPSPFFLIVPESFDGKIPEEWRARAETVASARARVFTRKRMSIRLLRVDLAESGDEGDDVPIGPMPGTQEVRYP